MKLCFPRVEISVTDYSWRTQLFLQFREAITFKCVLLPARHGLVTQLKYTLKQTRRTVQNGRYSMCLFLHGGIALQKEQQMFPRREVIHSEEMRSQNISS